MGWITVEPTSGTVPANGNSTLTATYSCDAEENRSGSITVTGSNGSLDRSTVTLNVDCQRPEIEVEVLSSPANANVTLGNTASTQFTWKFTSTWDGQSALDYEITESGGNVTISDSTGSASLDTDSSHTVEYTCPEEETTDQFTLNLAIDGQTVANTWEVVCRKPNLTVVITDPIESTKNFVDGGEETFTYDFRWTLESEDSDPQTYEYGIAWVAENGEAGRPFEAGNVEVGAEKTSSVSLRCVSGSKDELRVRVTVEESHEEMVFVRRCEYHEPHHLDIKFFQGVEALHVVALFVKTEEDEGTSYSWDMTYTKNVDVFTERETFVAIEIEYLKEHVRPVVPPSTHPDHFEEVLVYAITDDGEVLLDDLVRVYERDDSRPGYYHGYVTIYNVPLEYLEDFDFRFVLDPDDEIVEETEDNNEILVDNEEEWFTFSSLEPMKIVALPVDIGEDFPDDLLSLDHAIYKRVDDVLPVESMTLTEGATLDFSEDDDWDLRDVLDDVRREWLEHGSIDEFYVGLHQEGPRDGSCGVAELGGNSSVTSIGSNSGGVCRNDTLSHELGHNLALVHTVACDAPGPYNSDYPYEDGHVGGETAWITSQRSYRPFWLPRSDLMGYCAYKITSLYHYDRMSRELMRRAEEETAALPLALVTSLQPNVFEHGKTLLVSGRINAFGQWSTTFMKTVHKSMESVSKAGSGYSISLIESASGVVQYQEPLRVHDVDHAPHAVWSARLPVPEIPMTLSVFRPDGVLVHSVDIWD